MNWMPRPCDVRRQWMRMMGLDEDEINQHCADDSGDLEDELRQLEAMIDVQGIYEQLRSNG
jgi:hypothetical protein